MKRKMLIALMLFFVTEFAVAEDKVWYCSDLLVIGAEFNKSQWQISEWARGRHVIKQTADNQLEFWRFLTGEKGHVYCHSFSSPKKFAEVIGCSDGRTGISLNTVSGRAVLSAHSNWAFMPGETADYTTVRISPLQCETF